MKVNALLMDLKDNVVTCIRQVEEGETVYYFYGTEVREIIAREAVPYCHKIALNDLNEGDEIVKYGEVIGKTICPIEKGKWVSHLNIVGIPRSYDEELI